ncbi:MAG: F0F1 ATP synthase subunit A [Candidatus Pacebacteria bacterium]|nr:F0F1 ATP synthase subunit A [Candidatus Paceibacterota bacterium]
MSLGFERTLTPIQPEIVFEVFGFGIANSTLMILLIAVAFLLLGIFVVSKFTLVPGKFQSMIEMVYESIVGLVEQITGNRDHAKKIFPIIATILVYFALANVIAIIPGLTDITYKGVAIFRTPTSDFNTALGVSLASVVVLNAVAFKEYGFLGYLNNFFNIKGVINGFKKGVMDGFVGLIEFFVGLLDIIGELAKVVSLSFRLFGNVYAGQVLAIIIMGAFAYALPAVWTIMSGFTGILQGMVFAALVAVYYTLSLKPVKEITEK